MRSCSQNICIIYTETKPARVKLFINTISKVQSTSEAYQRQYNLGEFQLKDLVLREEEWCVTKGRWSVICKGDVGSAWEWCQIKLHTSCDVPAPLNQLKTTVVDGARSIFAPTVVSSPDQKHFPKMLPRRS